MKTIAKITAKPIKIKWIDIQGYEGVYQINNFGEVKSLRRKRKSGGILKERMIRTHLTHNGYEFVNLLKDGVKKNHRIHRLVAQHFIGDCPDGLVVHHKDHNKLNNCVENLEYVSRQYNTQEYYKTKGKSTGLVPITEIPLIKKRVDNGEEVYKIAYEYGVTRNDIAVICKIIALTGEELTI